ncbi:MAG: ATP-binding protein, partial [SAR324 cluster bacterium]|nr:ATP-binding protein [SAR324 cluster bacterium]
MTQRVIEDLFSRRVRNSIGSIKSREQALNFEQLKIYYNETSVNLNKQFAHNLELLTADGAYNYAAYLLSDVNGLSVKVAKYSGINRVNLIENEEYGYCSIIKATKAVLEKLKVENKTFAHITFDKREEQKLINPIALREAVINAIIHNDYSNEVPPKFELFDDRLEITSAGAIPSGFDEEEFFMGYSVPQNKELMRVFRDLDMVEQLGSGVPRILESYPRTIYNFTANFIRLVLPFDKKNDITTEQATEQATEQVNKVLEFCKEGRSRKEIQEFLGLKHREHFRSEILNPLLEQGLLKLTLPEKPKSPKQKYVTQKIRVTDM